MSNQEPAGWAYKYADNCIRFNHGEMVNGGMPVESIPYFFAPEAMAEEAEAARKPEPFTPPSLEKIQGGMDVLMQIRSWVRMCRIPLLTNERPSAREFEGFIESLYGRYEKALSAAPPASATADEPSELLAEVISWLEGLDADVQADKLRIVAAELSRAKTPTIAEPSELRERCKVFQSHITNLDRIPTEIEMPWWSTKFPEFLERFVADELSRERERSAELRNQRLFDLVRYKRMELHNDRLITNEEYSELAQEHSAVKRLEDYDAAIAAERQKSAARDAKLKELEEKWRKPESPFNDAASLHAAFIFGRESCAFELQALREEK